MTSLAAEPGTTPDVQQAVDWMFVLTLEWFGLPDQLKRHGEQVGYQLKGKTNDQLRQAWMAATVPLCERLGFSVPAHLDQATGADVVDWPLPIPFREQGQPRGRQG